MRSIINSRKESLHLLRAAKLQLLQENLAVVEELSAGLEGLRDSLEQRLRQSMKVAGQSSRGADSLAQLTLISGSRKKVDQRVERAKTPIR